MMQIESNPEFLRPVKSDELLPTIDRWATLGGLALLTSCGGAIALSAILKYPVTVKASATVRPAGDLRVIEAQGTGTVKEILVKENQKVAKGEVVAIVDSQQLETRRSQVVLNIRQNKLQLEQIDAQLQALEGQINAEKTAMERSIASAQADLVRSQREYSDRQITSQAEVKEAQAALDLSMEEWRRYEKLGSTGAISLLQIEQKKQAFIAAQARLQRVKVALNPTSALVAIARQRIAQERARGESALAALSGERKSLLQRRISMENQIKRDQQELKQILTDIQKSIIRTVEAGTIFKMQLRNPGQVVRPGQAIAQLAPSKAPLVVKGRVSAQDISKVKVCKAESVADCSQGKVQMRISAYPYPDYGTLKGAVREITADAITPGTDAATASPTSQNTGAAAYYEVTIEPERLYLEKDLQMFSIQSGMEVSADIISREETVLAFILRKARLITDM